MKKKKERRRRKKRRRKKRRRKKRRKKKELRWNLNLSFPATSLNPFSSSESNFNIKANKFVELNKNPNTCSSLRSNSAGLGNLLAPLQNGVFSLDS
jgi:hypothetical protein